MIGKGGSLAVFTAFKGAPLMALAIKLAILAFMSGELQGDMQKFETIDLTEDDWRSFKGAAEKNAVWTDVTVAVDRIYLAPCGGAAPVDHDPNLTGKKYRLAERKAPGRTVGSDAWSLYQASRQEGSVVETRVGMDGHGRLLVTIGVTKMTLAVTLLYVKHINDRDGYFDCLCVCHNLSKGMITNAQIRAARALLDWKQTDLAEAAKVSEMSVKNLEKGNKDPRVSTVKAVQTAFESAGIEFIDGGVRLRDRQA